MNAPVNHASDALVIADGHTARACGRHRQIKDMDETSAPSRRAARRSSPSPFAAPTSPESRNRACWMCCRRHNTYLPNTAGCYSADDAVHLPAGARTADGHDLVKLEVLGDEKTLCGYPRHAQAAEILVKDGFKVMVYYQRWPDYGQAFRGDGLCGRHAAGRAVGSGLGIRNPYNIRFIVEEARVPSLSIPASAPPARAIAMELCCAGVHEHRHRGGTKPVLMASAMRKAKAGRGRFAPDACRAAVRLTVPPRWVFSRTSAAGAKDARTTGRFSLALLCVLCAATKIHMTLPSKPHRPIRASCAAKGASPSAEARAGRMLPRYGIAPGEHNSTSLRSSADAPLHVEVASATAGARHMAAAHPQNNYLGIEASPGRGALLRRVGPRVANVRVACTDAKEFLEQRVPEGSLNAVHIFFRLAQATPPSGV